MDTMPTPIAVFLVVVLSTITLTTALDLDMELNFRGQARVIQFATEGLDASVAEQGAALFCDAVAEECTEEDLQSLRDQIKELMFQTTERLWKNDVLRDILSTRKVTDSMGNSHELTSAITASEGLFLYDMIVQNRMTRTLEVGMAYGVSTLYMLQAHSDLVKSAETQANLHVAVDPNQSSQWFGVGTLHARRAGLEGFLQLREEPSHLAMPSAVRANERYQMILIDGMHTFDFTLVDFFYADMLIEPNGVIVFDDKQMPSVQAVVSFVTTNRAYRLVDTPGLMSSRFAIVQKIRDDDRSWDFHREF